MNREHSLSGLAVPATPSFHLAQWRMLLATMFCYLFFYTGRQTFGFAIPGMQAINGNGERVILRERGSRTRQLVEEACQRAGIELDCAMQLNSREAIVHAIAQGIGIGFVSAVEYAETPGTRPITFVDHPFHIEYHLCCLGIRRNRPMIAELFEGSIPPPT